MLSGHKWPTRLSKPGSLSSKLDALTQLSAPLLLRPHVEGAEEDVLLGFGELFVISGARLTIEALLHSMDFKCRKLVTRKAEYFRLAER